MYEFVQGMPPLALGSNGVTREFCNGLSYEALVDEHWNECRTLVTAAHWCQLSEGASCSRQTIADLCSLSSASNRPPDCASYVAAPVTPTVRRQVSTGRQDIIDLQTWLVSIGCSLPRYGIDGRWGSETSSAVDCAERQGHASTIAQRFPFVSTMRVTPTGQARPPDFAFDPGTGKRTPEQVVAAGNPGGAGGSVVSPGSTQADVEADRQQRAGFGASIPLWGWALIAAGGVTLLGIAGFVLLGEE